MSESSSLYIVQLKRVIHAPIKNQMKRIEENYDVKSDDPESVIYCIDKVRANYYRHYTGNIWGDRSNYYIILDIGTLGIDGCVNVMEAVKVKLE